MYTLTCENKNMNLILTHTNIYEILNTISEHESNLATKIVVEDAETGEVLYWRDTYASGGLGYATREFNLMLKGYKSLAD